MSYKKSSIWELSREVVKDVRKMTLKELPRFDLFEELYNSIHAKITHLGKKPNLFIQAVERR